MKQEQNKLPSLDRPLANKQCAREHARVWCVDVCRAPESHTQIKHANGTGLHSSKSAREGHAGQINLSTEETERPGITSRANFHLTRIPLMMEVEILRVPCIYSHLQKIPNSGTELGEQCWTVRRAVEQSPD